MILNSEQIADAGIVVGASDHLRRSTSYDASIGEFILDGQCLEGDTYRLPPRGIVWVVSKETFKFGKSHTGLATLKTTLTHKGILALNVGVIDPGFEGPLSTALVNFSRTVVELKRGGPFFRVLVAEHTQATIFQQVKEERYDYINRVVNRSTGFSNSFLDTNSLGDEVANRIFGLPKLTVIVGVAGLFLALITLVASICFAVIGDISDAAALANDLDRRVEKLEKIVPPAGSAAE